MRPRCELLGVLSITQALYSLLLLTPFYTNTCSGLLFARKASSVDNGLAFVTQQTSQAKTMGSAVECAAYVSNLAQTPIKGDRPSAFTYVKSNSSCTPARTLAFEIFEGTIAGDVNIYEIVGKPNASTNLDTWFYALLNEERSAYFSHPNFINAWPSSQVPDWNTNIAYDIPSPVVSYGGQYAMTFTDPAGLWFSALPVASTKHITMLAWYKPVEDVSGHRGIVALIGPNGYISLQMHGGYIICNIRNTGDGAEIWPQSATPAATNHGPWIYVGFSLDLIANTVSYWLNGAFFGTSSVTVSDPGPQMSTIRIANNLGYNALASVEIYMQTLNQTQVQAAMAKSTTGRTTTAQLPN